MTITSISISSDDRAELLMLHDDFGKKIKWAACSTAAAAFLLVGALIVITCGCLCLMLPGVNVVNHVILRAVVPGIFGILISLPLILFAVRNSLDKKIYHTQLIDTMVSYLDTYGVPEKSRKQRVNFILYNFIKWRKDPNDPNNAEKLLKNKNWTKEYQGKTILSAIKSRIGTSKQARNPRQEKIATAIDKARSKINS